MSADDALAALVRGNNGQIETFPVDIGVPAAVDELIKLLS